MSRDDHPGEGASIELLKARADIEDAVHRYALCVRSGKADDCVNLFTIDATFEVREGNPGDPSSVRSRSTLQGRDAIVNFDHQGLASLLHGDRICVRRSEHRVRMLHPRGWSYYATLRRKLHWNEGAPQGEGHAP